MSADQRLTDAAYANVNDSGATDATQPDATAANPVVRRRRRRIVRHVREKTPEPSAKGGTGRPHYSDDDDDDADADDATTDATDHADDNTVTGGVDDDISGGGGGVGVGRPSRQAGRQREAETGDVDAATGHPGPAKSSISGAGATHRNKILTMRDRGVGPSKVVRSQSSPRVADAVVGEALMVAGSIAAGGGIGGGVAGIGAVGGLRPVKRSLSSQRHPEELLNRHFSRDSRAPAREIPDSTTPDPATSPTTTGSPRRSPPASTSAQHQQQLTKLERNLLRFEEERRRFEEEKVRFEQEKRDAETALRNRRLQAFQRKRDERREAEAVDHDVHQKLCSILRVIEDSNKYHLPGISPSPTNRRPMWRTSSGEEDAGRQPTSASSASPVPVVIRNAVPMSRLEVLEFANESSAGEVGEDYESSTAKSTSSREGDFDDEEAEDEVTVMEESGGAEVVNKADNMSESANIKTPAEPETETADVPQKRSWLARLLGRKPTPRQPPKPMPAPSVGPVSIRRFIFTETRLVWHQLLADHADEWQQARRGRNRCFADLVILMIVCGVGGLTFRFVEGAFENFYKCGVRRVKRDFVDHLWTTSHNLREDDWKTVARAKLRAFEEELHVAHEAGMTSYSGMKAWTFVNGMMYCLTVITTIGYGHIVPSTNTGRCITIIYATIGIPLFMILLNDFGKYFTWRIKFMVAFLRRLGNTSSLGRIYRQVYIQKIIRTINKIYSLAIFKRNRAIITPDPNFKGSTLDLANNNINNNSLQVPVADSSSAVVIFRDSAIDDEFDLPVSVALAFLVAYIAAGSVFFSILEGWSLFESSYFAFVSMSTIGLGDYVPTYPIYMFGSIGYLVFGLALTSMCLSVLQARLDGALNRICARIGGILGLDIGERSPANIGAAVFDRPPAAQGDKQRVRKVKRRSVGKVKVH